MAGPSWWRGGPSGPHRCGPAHRRAGSRSGRDPVATGPRPPRGSARRRDRATATRRRGAPSAPTVVPGDRPGTTVRRGPRGSRAARGPHRRRGRRRARGQGTDPARPLVAGGRPHRPDRGPGAARCGASDPPRSAAKSLQTFVLRLRNVLEPDAERPRTRRWSPSRPATGSPCRPRRGRRPPLRPAGRGRAARALQGGRPDEAHQRSTAALSLWRGPRLRRLRGHRVRCARGRPARGAPPLASRTAPPRRWSWAARRRPCRTSSGWSPSTRTGSGPGPCSSLPLYRSERQSDALAAYDRVRTLLAERAGRGPRAGAARAARPGARPGPGAAPGRAARRAAGSCRTACAGPAAGGRALAPRPCSKPPLQAGPGPSCGRARGGGRRGRPGRARPGSGRHRVALALAEEVRPGGHGQVVHVRGRVAGAPPDRAPGGGGQRLVVVEPGPAAPAGRTRAAPVVRLVDADARPPRPRPRRGAVLVRVRSARDDVRRMLAAPPAGGRLARARPDAGRRGRGRPGAAPTRAGAPTRSTRWAREWSRRLVAARVERAAGRAEASDVVAAQRPRGPAGRGRGAARPRRRGRRRPADRCPWPGLLAYDVADADRFAGGSGWSPSASPGSRRRGCSGWSGPPGSGKSSLVRAGVLAALAEGALPGQRDLDPPAPAARAPTRWSSSPGPRWGRRPGPVGVDDLVGRLLDGDGAGTRTLLVVDQAEELWTDLHGPRRAGGLPRRRWASSPSRPARPGGRGVRSASCSSSAPTTSPSSPRRPALAAAVADCTVLVGPPSPQEVRRAVELPAARGGPRPGRRARGRARRGRRRGAGRAAAAVDRAAGAVGAAAGLAAHAGRATSPRVRCPARWPGWPRARGRAWTRPPQETARVVLTRLAGPGEGDAVTRRRVPSGRAGARWAAPTSTTSSTRLVRARLCTAARATSRWRTRRCSASGRGCAAGWPRTPAASRCCAADGGGGGVGRRRPRPGRCCGGGHGCRPPRDAVDRHRDLVTGRRAGLRRRRAPTPSSATARRRGAGGAGAAVQPAAAGAARRSGRAARRGARRRGGRRRAGPAGSARHGSPPTPSGWRPAAVNEDYHDLALLSAVEAVRTRAGARDLRRAAHPAVGVARARHHGPQPGPVPPGRGPAGRRHGVPRRERRRACAPWRRTAPPGGPPRRWAAAGQRRRRRPTARSRGRWTVDEGDVLRGARRRDGRGACGGWGPTCCGEEWLGPDMAWLPGGELVARRRRRPGGRRHGLPVGRAAHPLARGHRRGRRARPLGDGRLLVQAGRAAAADGGGEHAAAGRRHPHGEVTPTAPGGPGARRRRRRGPAAARAPARRAASPPTLTVVGGRRTSRPLAPTVRVPGLVRSAAFSPDGSVLAVGDGRGGHARTTARPALPTGQVLARPQRHGS